MAISRYRRCGPVSQYENQKAEDWQSSNTDQWLSTWVDGHSEDVSSNPYGFAGAFGKWAIGNPDWSCRDDGSASSCDLDLCDNRVLNERGDDIRPTYYVLESINRLHSYFNGISQAFQVSAIASSLRKESWSKTFYQPKDDSKSIDALKTVLNGLTTVVGIGAAFADDTFDKDAELGSVLANVVVESMKDFTHANNELVAGKDYASTGDIKTYLSGGTFVDFPGVDKNAVIDVMNAFLLGHAINQLWRQQKVFILGGGKCGDGEGIGSGPQDYSICRDGKAWYLYYWHEGKKPVLTSKQWGYVTMPPGADKLGSDDFTGITISDIISSSVDAYNVAEYNYDSEKAAERVNEALRDGWRNPGKQGPSWEGTFTIPVCDVGSAVGQDWKWKEFILEEYDEDARPVWCGPICSNDWEKTKRFINAANMDGFESPKHLCVDEGVDIYY
ncbi:uncharacterized protein K452DRAFT_329273 [Aplosporella prunicola CBS 121167]|uniref:Uncharacterized protein n=1 Tax=Aplosporella prunicola CBS 121167 TaxID=1176127 RepID=A0A6A6B2B8_9PEZI|nr:uncharacterized protein K452DRAFT_329273 [Aplosporella prunicola CBS 121167]KAF2137405.1 hypothetical protein K452DRAFT_329273 [Aplosporella prunicola CBS 121167]